MKSALMPDQFAQGHLGNGEASGVEMADGGQNHGSHGPSGYRVIDVDVGEAPWAAMFLSGRPQPPMATVNLLRDERNDRP